MRKLFQNLFWYIKNNKTQWNTVRNRKERSKLWNVAVAIFTILLSFAISYVLLLQRLNFAWRYNNDPALHRLNFPHFHDIRSQNSRKFIHNHPFFTRRLHRRDQVIRIPNILRCFNKSGKRFEWERLCNEWYLKSILINHFEI